MSAWSLASVVGSGTDVAHLPSSRHYRSNDDCLEGEMEDYQVSSVQNCVQQLCIVQCTHIWTDVTVVDWLDLAFLWLYCVLWFVCVRFSFFGIILCYGLFVYACFCCVRFSFFSTVPRDWLGRTSPKWPILCGVGRKTLTQSISANRYTFCCQTNTLSFGNRLVSIRRHVHV